MPTWCNINKSAVIAISDKYNLNPIASSVQKLITTGVAHVCISWVKGHIGIIGNEKADFLAKSAAQSDLPFSYSKCPLSYVKRTLKTCMLHEWNELWTKSTNGNVTRQLYFPTIYDRLKCKNIVQNFVLSQFLSGHGKFTEYLYRFKLSTSPTCSCGSETQNVHHLLFQCPLFSRERYHFELLLDSVGLTFSIPFTKILLNHNSYKFFNSFIHQIFCKLKT